MSRTPNIDELKNETAKLQKLLNDPHMGVYGYMVTLADQLDKIAEFAPSYQAIDTLAKIVEESQ